MPSIVSILTREQIRLAKPLLARMSIQADRAAQDRVGDIGARALAGKATFEPVAFARFEAEMIMPRELERDGVILYLHGGGYTAGSLKYAHGFGSLLASRLGIRTLCAAYRLAPENPFPAALDDAYAAYLYLLEQGCSARRIFLVGESAGGGLLFCLTHRLKREGVALPGKLVAISPWTDLAMQGASYTYNEKADPALTRGNLAGYARMYAGQDLTNPYVSPIYGDFAGFPPALVFAGGDELLLDDSYALARKYAQAGAQCRLHVEEGLWHVYVLFSIPEARAALDRIDAFLKEDERR